MADTEGTKPARTKASDEGLFVVGEPDSRKGKKVPVKVTGPFTSRGKAINYQRKCDNPEATFILKIREIDGWQDQIRRLIGEPLKVVKATKVARPKPVDVVTSDELGATGPSVPTKHGSWWNRIRGN